MAVPLDMDDSKIQIPDDYTKQLLAQLGFMEYTDTSRHEADFEKKYRSYWENHQPRCGSNKSGIHYKKCPLANDHNSVEFVPEYRRGSDEPAPTKICPIKDCTNHVVANWSDMNRHLLIHLPDTVQPFVCLWDGCGAVHTQWCNFRTHFTTHIPTEATRGKAHLWCGLPVEESDGTMRKCRFRCNNQEHLQRHRKGTENYREGHHSTNGAASVQSTEDTKTSRHLSSTSSAPRRRKRKVPLESSPALSSPPPTKRRRSKASPLILWTTTPSAPHTEPGPLHLRNGVPPPSPPPPCPLAPQLQAETRRCDASNLTPSDERPIAPLPSRSTPCVFLPLSAAWSLPFKRPSTYRGGLTGAFSAHSRDIYYRPSWLS